MLPEGLEERFRELRRRPTAREALKKACAAAQVRAEHATDERCWLDWDPLDPPRNAPPPRRLDRHERDCARAGLDARGRPVRIRLGMTTLLVTWGERKAEIVRVFHETGSVASVTWADLDEKGRPTTLARRGATNNALGKGARIAWLEWDGDHCVRQRSLTQVQESRVWWMPEVRVAEYDAEGLLRIRTGDDRGREDADAAVASLDSIQLDAIDWDRERDGFEPDPPPVAEIGDAWTDALLSAVSELAAELDDEVFAVRLSTSWDHLDVSVYPASRREALRRRVRSPQDVLYHAGEPCEPVPRLGATGTRMRRLLRQLDWDERRALVDADRAARALRALDAMPWRRSEPFLPMIVGDLVPEPHDYDVNPYWHFSETVLGPERVAAFVESLERPDGAPAPAAATRLRDRPHLAAILGERELDPARAEEAAWGIALLPGGRGRSRLGGAPLLPEGMDWPAHEGRGLTHLVSIDLSELPEVEGRDALPEDGLLVLLADLTEEAALWEPTIAARDPRIALLHVPAGAPVHEPAPPRAMREAGETPVKLRKRIVRFEPVLTVPGWEDAGYDDLAGEIVEVTPGLAEPSHLLLGHPAVVQEDPREPGEINVLHLGWDEDLGFEFLDGGDLTLHGNPEDVRAGRWERLVLSPNSC